jgi:hypothetical protein
MGAILCFFLHCSDNLSQLMATSQDSDRSPSDKSDTEEHNPNTEEKKNKRRRKQPSYPPLPGTYLFDFPIDALKPGPPSAARVHIRRVLDVLHISISRRDTIRARRAWSILARCEEVQWRALWRTAVHVLDMDGDGEGCTFLYRMRWDQEVSKYLKMYTSDWNIPRLSPFSESSSSARLK